MNNYVWLHGSTGMSLVAALQKKTINLMEIVRQHLENRMLRAIVASREGRSRNVLKWYANPGNRLYIVTTVKKVVREPERIH